MRDNSEIITKIIFTIRTIFSSINEIIKIPDVYKSHKIVCEIFIKTKKEDKYVIYAK